VETRSTFAGLQTWQIVAWYGLIAVSVVVFLWGVGRLVAKYRRGRRDGSLAPLRARLGRSLAIVASHRTLVRRDRVAGVAHALVFYGFLLLLAGTTILAVQDDLLGPLGVHFWRGSFYLAYSLVLDLAGAALVVGLGALSFRRGILRPAKLDYARTDGAAPDAARRRYVTGDWVFLGALAFLAGSGFVLEALRLAMHAPAFERWSPIGYVGGKALADAGLGGASAGTAHFALWWVHGVVALSFVASVPFTKAVHMLVAPVSLAARDPLVGRRLTAVREGAATAEIGYGVVTDVAMRHLVDLDACTKCGRCHEACPAAASGLPLSPRDLVLDLREAAEGALGARRALGLAPVYDGSAPLVGNAVSAEAVWSCMTCMACVEICPVGIEHVPIINELRRHLVERGEIDELVQGTLETIHQTGNSFGEARRKRGRWAKDLGFPVKDARKEPVDLLWFVGDYASFEPRALRGTVALARILDHAGVDFGLLYDGERTAGNDVRRIGEEGLYGSLAEANVATLAEARFARMLTSDPHTLNTIRNEYPAFGATYAIEHHSELLARLLRDGVLTPGRPLGYRATYHDPCHLGRLNGVFEAPRAVLAALGVELIEMPRNRDASYCCGAGGGRIWMREERKPGCARPSEQRIDEALAAGAVDLFVVSCPKDVAMYADAVKTSGNEGRIEVRELAELVLEALALPAEPERVEEGASR